jgi:hypothetical protein
MSLLDRNLEKKRKLLDTKNAADNIRASKKRKKDEKVVADEAGGGPMEDMAMFNAGSYLQTLDARKKLLKHYGMSDTWSIDEKNSGDDWVVYKRETPEKGKPDNVIAYRGSAKARDWYTNSTIATNSFNTSPRYLRSKKEFQRISTELSGTKMTTGHSLGGLIALSLGRDFGVPSVTFNRAAGWDQLENDLDSVNSVNYTTNKSGGATDAVSLASYWAPSKGEKVVSVSTKEGNKGLMGAHGLDNFLPAEKKTGFLDDLTKEDTANTVKSITKDMYEISREIGANKSIDKTAEFFKGVTWKMIMGYGTDKLLTKLIKEQVITGEAAERIQAFQAFYDNPTTIAAQKVGQFLEKHLGPARDFLKGKVKGTWEEIKSRMPQGDDMSEWEPETTGWGEDKWEYGMEDDNPAYDEPAEGGGDYDFGIDDQEPEDVTDPLEGFEEPEVFEDDEKGPGAWEDEHETALPDEPAPETFPEMDQIGGDDVLHDVELGGEETVVEGAVEDGIGEGLMDGALEMGPESAAIAPLMAMDFLWKMEAGAKRDKANEDAQVAMQLARNQSIEKNASDLGFTSLDLPINDFVKKHPEMGPTFKKEKGEDHGVMQYDYDYDAFYGPRAAEYLKWRNDNKEKLGTNGISVGDALTKLKETNNPFTNAEEAKKNISERRKRERGIRDGSRYDESVYRGPDGKGAHGDQWNYKNRRESVRFHKKDTAHKFQTLMGEVERRDEEDKQKGGERNEVIYRQTLDKTVTGEKTTDEKGNVHWVTQTEKDAKNKGELDDLMSRYKAALKKPHGDGFVWDGRKYVHNTDKQEMAVRYPGHSGGSREAWLHDPRNGNSTPWPRTGSGRDVERDTQGGGLPEVDINSSAGKGNVHTSLAGNNTKHPNGTSTTKNDRLDGHTREDVDKLQKGSQGTGKGHPEPNRQAHEELERLEKAFHEELVRRGAGSKHHPLDPLQPHGEADVNTNHNAEGHPAQTPAHQVAPGENHNPFSGTPGTSEHTFGVQGTGGITMRQLHQRSALQNVVNQAVLGQAADVNFMRALNAREGRW